MVRTLIDYGIDVEVKEVNGRTAIHLAAIRASEACLQLILDAIPDPEVKLEMVNCPDKVGNPPSILPSLASFLCFVRWSGASCLGPYGLVMDAALGVVYEFKWPGARIRWGPAPGWHVQFVFVGRVTRLRVTVQVPGRGGIPASMILLMCTAAPAGLEAVMCAVVGVDFKVLDWPGKVGPSARLGLTPCLSGRHVARVTRRP